MKIVYHLSFLRVPVTEISLDERALGTYSRRQECGVDEEGVLCWMRVHQSFL